MPGLHKGLSLPISCNLTTGEWWNGKFPSRFGASFLNTFSMNIITAPDCHSNWNRIQPAHIPPHMFLLVLTPCFSNNNSERQTTVVEMLSFPLNETSLPAFRMDLPEPKVCRSRLKVLFLPCSGRNIKSLKCAKSTWHEGLLTAA